MWITNAYHADYMVMLANTNDGPAHNNKSLIVVPMKQPGTSKIIFWLREYILL